MPNKPILSLRKVDEIILGEVLLTGSKSECNRALILSALSDGMVTVENISASADTVTLQKILHTEFSEGAEINVGPAGTAMRFLTAYLAVKGIKTVLTGSVRMKERPIGILVNALRDLGAEISYGEKDGFPPLVMHEDFIQKTSKLKIKGNISSQYISALLLIASSLPKGLQLEIEGELTSKPYVEMTLTMLKQTGIKHSWEGNKITIQSQKFIGSTIYVEPDWSAASYWYAIVALAEIGSRIFLKGLQKTSIQGDSTIVEIMKHFGVNSTFTEDGVYIERVEIKYKKQLFDLKNCPDLAQTIVVVCAALKFEASFTGLETLKIKETDRVKALQNELVKIGVQFIENNEIYTLDCSALAFPTSIRIETYDDHRMAMAFAPLAIKIDTVEIEDPEVVVKSYPDFWKDLSKLGFKTNLSS